MSQITTWGGPFEACGRESWRRPMEPFKVSLQTRVCAAVLLAADTFAELKCPCDQGPLCNGYVVALTCVCLAQAF